MDQKSPYSECEPNITNKEILKVELLQSLSKAALIIFDGRKLEKIRNRQNDCVSNYYIIKCNTKASRRASTGFGQTTTRTNSIKRPI